MRISVSDIGRTFGRQTRAYSEYRIFSTLSRFGDVVRDVRVLLTPTTATGEPAALCVVVVTIGTGQRLQVRARGRHVYDAVNRAAQRISHALRGESHGAQRS
jgi:hypothetical protein